MTIKTISALAIVLGLAASAAAEQPDYEFTWDWVSQDSSVWLEHLGSLKGEPNLRALEVGSYEGRSAIWFLENILTADSSQITCVDIFNDSEIEGRFDRNIAASGFADRVKKMKGDSRAVLSTLDFESFDFVYIDGCHKASCILSDAVFSLWLTKPGGIIIFDDYGIGADWLPHTRPATAIDAFLKIFQDGLEVLHKDPSTVVIRRIVLKSAPAG